MRDMFYNGNAAYEPGAIVMRVAPSFLRFGNFEILAARKNWTTCGNSPTGPSTDIIRIFREKTGLLTGSGRCWKEQLR
jgi:hypothetical protein